MKLLYKETVETAGHSTPTCRVSWAFQSSSCSLINISLAFTYRNSTHISALAHVLWEASSPFLACELHRKINTDCIKSHADAAHLEKSPKAQCSVTEVAFDGVGMSGRKCILCTFKEAVLDIRLVGTVLYLQ